MDNIVQVDQTRNENYGKFYNVLGLVRGKYGKESIVVDGKSFVLD